MAAVGHYCFLAHLHDQIVDDSIISQGWATRISVIFTRVFSISLSIALGTAYTQLLWRRLRRTALKISTIDRLFSMSSNPLKTLHSSGITNAPTLWLAAVFLPCVPIAAIFPPGALEVVSILNTTSFDWPVPTYDFNYRGNSTSYQALDRHALFIQGPDGEYR